MRPKAHRARFSRTLWPLTLGIRLTSGRDLNPRGSFRFTLALPFGRVGGDEVHLRIGKMVYGLMLSMLLMILWGEARAAPASACVVTSPHYQLTSDNVDWSIKIGSGQTCVRGLRYGGVVLETVKLLSPPQSGEVKLLGPGFSYKARPDFHGDDSFTVEVSGIVNKVRGTSTIRVLVSVDGPSSASP